jgi:hypothetical protein
MMLPRACGDTVTTCGPLIDASSAEDKRVFLRELATIRAGIPSYSQLLSVDGLDVQIGTWGNTLSEAQLAMLPENARARALESAKWLNDEPPQRRLALWLWRPSYLEKWAAMVEAAAPGPSRDHDFAIVEQQTSFSEDVVGFSFSHGVSGIYESLMHRYDPVALEFDLLESAARVDLGESPLPTVATRAIDGGVELRVAWDAGVGASITLHPDDGTQFKRLP